MCKRTHCVWLLSKCRFNLRKVDRLLSVTLGPWLVPSVFLSIT